MPPSEFPPQRPKKAIHGFPKSNAPAKFTSQFQGSTVKDSFYCVISKGTKGISPLSATACRDGSKSLILRLHGTPTRRALRRSAIVTNPLRTKSATAKVTEEEYQQLEAAAKARGL